MDNLDSGPSPRRATLEAVAREYLPPSVDAAIEDTEISLTVHNRHVGMRVRLWLSPAATKTVLKWLLAIGTAIAAFLRFR